MTDRHPSQQKIRDAHPSPLEERIKLLIRRNGPISIEDYMTDALSHPHEGYYMTRHAIGKDGDFTTAPEISQVFGELIGLWLVQSWHDLGSPNRFNLVELGPGRGVLMDDILRAARLRPEFIKACSIYLVETSGRLRHEQKKRLTLHKEAHIHWADKFEDIPDAPTLVIANEFFDCLPIQQYQKTKTGWHERMIGLDHNNNLTFELAPAPSKPAHPLGYDQPVSTCNTPNDPQPAKDDDILEISPSAKKITKVIAQFLSKNNGRALFIDYGHYSSAYGDTFQSIRDHQFWPPLQSPGKADLTAHVDFQQIAETSLHEGIGVYGPLAQGPFLDRLGISYRVETLSRGKTEEEIITLRDGVSRLISPNQMGELFKVMVLSSPDLDPPAGFEVNS